MAERDRMRRSVGQRKYAATDAAAVSLEGLEARQLMATYTVTTAIDVVDSNDGLLSLREALVAANTNQPFSDAPAGDLPTLGVDLINFNIIEHAPGGVDDILLTLGELPITEAVTIMGPATPATITISGSDEIRIFNITGNNVTLSNLTLTNGRGMGGGGGIRMSGGGTLNIMDSTIQNCAALGSGDSPAWGGGILNLGSTINFGATGGSPVDPANPNDIPPPTAVIQNNMAVNGGGIYSQGGTVNLTGVTVTNNTSSGNGAGIYVGGGGTLNVTKSGGAANGPSTILPALSIGTAQADPEGDVGTRSVTYNVSLNRPSLQVVSVDFVATSLPGDTATDNVDYQATSGTVTFLPGQTAGLITVNFIGDDDLEVNRSFHIILSNPANAVVDNGQCVATIEDDDATPAGPGPIVSIGTTHRDFEGDTTSRRQYDVSLSYAAAEAVIVNYTLGAAGDTATGDVDYEIVSGTLTFAPGELTKSILVPFIGDDDGLERDESFTITLALSGGSGDAREGNLVSKVWIENDDVGSRFMGNQATGLGGGLYASNATVTVVGAVFNVTDIAQGVAAPNSALDGGNLYLTHSTVTINNDVDIRGNAPESGFGEIDGGVAARNGGGIFMSDSTVTIAGGGTVAGGLRIQPNISIGSLHADPEPGVGLERTVRYNVILSEPVPYAITVDYVVSSQPGDTATADTDYRPAEGSLTFYPGQIASFIPVTLLGDADAPEDGYETFSIELSDPADGASGTILHGLCKARIDEVPASAAGPTVSIGKEHRDPEGDQGDQIVLDTIGVERAARYVRYEVSLSQPADTKVTVDYSVYSDGLALSEEDDATFTDYLLQSGTLTFAIGEVTQSILVPFVPDYREELHIPHPGHDFDYDNPDYDPYWFMHESFHITLQNLTGTATLGNAESQAWIEDDEQALVEVFVPRKVGQVNITGNTAINGGGIYQDGGTLSVVDATIEGNLATSEAAMGLGVSIVGTVSSSSEADRVTGTITGTLTVGGVIMQTGDIGSFTADGPFVGTVPVNIIVTIGNAIAGAFVCDLTVGADGNGSFGGAGSIAGSGSATFIGTISDADSAANNNLKVTVGATAVVSGPPATMVTGLGGGIFATNGRTTSKNASIVSNKAQFNASSSLGGVPVKGGGIYALFHHLALDSTVINDNVSEGNGAGIFLEHSEATLNQVTLGTNNVTTVDSSPVAAPTVGSISGTISGTGFGASRSAGVTFAAGGGALPLNLSVSGIGTGTFVGNIVAYGQIVGVVTGTVVVVPGGSGTIVGEVYTFGAGSRGTGALLNATISGGGLSGSIGGSVVLPTVQSVPTSGLGAGVYVSQGSTLELNSSTVANNTAPIGGGVYVAYPAPATDGIAGKAGTVEVNSSIIADNTATAGGIAPDVYGVVTARRTLIKKGEGAKVYGSGNLVGKTIEGIDAKLMPRDVNGGWFDLAPGSPAINSGANPAGETKDTRGWPRLFGPNYDMGAVEHQADIGPRIDVEIGNREQVEIYNFGYIPFDTSKTSVFTIRNEGTDDLTVDSVTRFAPLLPTVFLQSLENGLASGDNWIILPGRTFTFTIEASPTVAIPDLMDSFILSSDDPIRDVHALGVTVNRGPDVPDMRVDNVSIVEGNSGTKNLVFTLTLSSPSTSTVVAQFAMSDGTAMVGQDYIAASGLVTFAPGQTSKTVTAKVNGDKMYEDDETFYLDLTNATGASIAGQPLVPGDPDDHTHQATATIVNNDAPPSIRIDDAQIFESNVGTMNLVLPVTLSAPSGKTVTVNYTTADGTASAGSDYTAQSGTLTFAPGSITPTVPLTVVVAGDATYEFDETFFVDLSGANNASIARARGTGTIRNDDDPPTLSIDSPSVIEGTGGTAFLNFTAYLNVASERPVTAKYTTVEGTAKRGVDFAPASGTVVFVPGETTAAILTSIVSDSTHESNETFQVKLSKVVGASLGIGAGTGTITNDDLTPSLSILDATVVKGRRGTKSMVFTVIMSNPSSYTALVNYATAPGVGPNAATTPDDFITKIGTLTFAPGETVKSIAVPVVGDTTVEPNETFFVDLSVPTFATIADDQGIGTIVNG